MKSWSAKKGDKELEEMHNDKDVWMTEARRKEREQDLREAYEIELGRQRKHERRREVDKKECCSYCKVQRWLCNFCHCHRESTGHIPMAVYDNGVSNRKREKRQRILKK